MEMYCHNPKCHEFNQEIEVNVIHSYDSPPELAYDTCYACGHELQESIIDPEIIAELIAEHYERLMGDLETEEERELAVGFLKLVQGGDAR